MNPAMQGFERELRALIEGNPITKGMTVRARGSQIYLGREDPPGPFAGDPDDRVRFTRLGKTSRFGLSVLRHTGKWEKTPFSGSLDELVKIVCEAMQHLVAER
jgi:uncharacterized protein (DUF58 family)